MKADQRYSIARAVRSILAFFLAAIVPACGGGGSGGGGAAASFALTSPSAGAASISYTPTFVWIDLPDELSYTLQVDLENTFSPPLTYEETTIPANTVTITIPNANALSANTIYYWRVIGIQSSGQTLASNAPLSFRTASSGSLLSDFGNGGVISDAPNASEGIPYGIAADASTFYVVGEGYAVTSRSWRIEKRYHSDGALVQAFGNGGIVNTNPTPGDDVARAIAIDSSHMYVVGWASPSGLDWRIEKRRLIDGALDFGFGFAGVVSSNLTGIEKALAITIDGTSMYVVGIDNGPLAPSDFGYGGYRWRIEKRSLATGALDTSFDSDGIAISGGGEFFGSVANDSQALYLVGSDGTNWTVQKRFLSNGSFDPGFGTNGILSFASTNTNRLHGIALDGTHMYLAGGGTQGAPHWRIEKRTLGSGSLDTSFGISGEVIVNPGLSNQGYAIVIDGSSIYIAGNDLQLGSEEWQTERRSSSTGLPVTSFGTGGSVKSGGGGGPSNLPFGIALSNWALYVIGDGNGGPNGTWRIEKRAK